MYPIILASSSPRRQEVLRRLGIPFIVHPPEIPEEVPEGMPPEQIAEFLANRKAEAVASALPPGQEDQWVLAADTVIVFEGRVYGKPGSRGEAVEFLRAFRGKRHQVLTGLALHHSPGTTKSRTCACGVTFAPMTDEEVDWYVGTGEWHGAAGGYRIQGLAACFIRRIEGSESGIMGLPIFELYDMLKEQSYSLIE